MSKFDVYIASVYFVDTGEYKNRPVVQIKEDPQSPNSFAMISTTEKDFYSGDVPITDKHCAGLKSKKTSRVRLSERLDYPQSVRTRQPVGRLCEKDIKEVEKAIHIPHKIKKHFAEALDDEFTLHSFLEQVD